MLAVHFYLWHYSCGPSVVWCVDSRTYILPRARPFLLRFQFVRSLFLIDLNSETCVNNRRNGHWQYYYTNGDLRKDVYLRNNKYHGKCSFWKINGSYEVRHYYKGKLHGERYRYRSDGTLFQKHVYDMGKPKEFYGQVELGLDK